MILARENFSGGGHHNAAGGKSDLSLEDTQSFDQKIRTMRGRLIKGIVCVLVMFTLLSCTEQQARKPIQQSKSQHIENSVQENRLRLAREVEVIEQWLTSQTSAFSETPHGIFYSYSNPKNRPILPPENLKKNLCPFRTPQWRTNI